MIVFELSNGDEITLEANAKVEFELVSSVFSDDIPAAHSTSISVPDVNGNFKKLGYANRFDVLQRVIRHDNVKMVIDGRPEYTGKLFVRRLNARGLSCFYVPNGFATDILDKKLVDVDYGADVTLGSTTSGIVSAASGYVPQNYPAVNFNFPTMYAPKAYNVEDAVAWRSVDNTDVFEFDTAYAVGDYVNYLIDGEPNLRGIYRCITATTAGEDPITTPAKWQLENGNCLVNNWDHGSAAFYSNDITGLETFNKHALSPQLYTKFILQSIAGTYGHRFYGDFMQDTATDQLLTHNNVLLDRGERSYFVRAEQDGVFDAAFNPNAGSGVQIVTAANNELIFNDEVTAPNEDADNVLNQAGTASQYQIQNAGNHTFTFYISISSNTTIGFTRLVLYLPYSGGTPNIGDNYAVIPAGFTGVFEYTYTYNALPADVGQYIQPELYNITSSYSIAMDAGSYMVVNNNAVENMNRYKGTVVYKQHVPDVTVADYLIGLKRRFNLNVIIDLRTKAIRLDYAKDLLTAAPSNYTDILQQTTYDFKDPQGLEINETFNSGLDIEDGEGVTIVATVNSLEDIDVLYMAPLNIGDVIHALAENKLYRVAARNSVTKYAEPLGNYYPQFTYGDGKRTLEMIGQPANMETVLTDADSIVVPRFDFVFSSDLFAMGRNDMPLVFSFWRGLQNGQKGVVQFPFASPHAYLPNGSSISGAIDLRFFDNAASVWNQLHQEWQRKTDGGLEVFADAHLTLKDVFEWDFTKPIRQRHNVMVRSKLIYEINQEGTIKAEVQAIKLQP